MGNDCNTCPALGQIETLSKQLDSYINSSRETHKEIYNRLNKLEISDGAREQQFTSIIEKLDNTNDMITSIQTIVDELRLKPGKRFDKLTETILTVLASGIVGYILGVFI